MTTKIFYDIDQAHRYLMGCIIRIDDRPVLVRDLYSNDRGKIGIQYRYLERVEGQNRILVNSKRVDLTPVLLGFVNVTDWGTTRAFKTFRSPARQWKIGLTRNSLRVLPAGGGVETKAKILYSKYMKDTIMGEFPSVADTLERVHSEDTQSVAFSRRFALTNEEKLLHLDIDEPVGFLYHNELMLDDKYIYLNEVLEKDMRV